MEQQLSQNEAAVLAELECRGPLTRTALAAQSGLPRTTVAGLIARLIDHGLIVEREALPSGVGRPPRQLTLAEPPRVVGVVSGGEAAGSVSLLSLSGELLGRTSGSAVRKERDLLDLASLADELLPAVLQSAGQPADRLAAVVLNVQGPVSPAQRAGRAAEVAGCHVPVRRENDANLGALGEAAFGAGRCLDSLIYVKLGRNVGAGLVVAGRLVRGAAGYAGELAHARARGETGEGAVCVCGGRGCLATLVGPSLVEFARRAYAERLALSEVLALAAEHDPGVSRVFSDLGRIIGRPLADLCTMIDPAAVIVDSTLGSAGELVLAGIRESIARHAAPVVADSVRVIPGELGEEAEVLGAVALARSGRLAWSGSHRDIG